MRPVPSSLLLSPYNVICHWTFLATLLYHYFVRPSSTIPPLPERAVPLPLHPAQAPLESRTLRHFETQNRTTQSQRNPLTVLVKPRKGRTKNLATTSRIKWYASPGSQTRPRPHRYEVPGSGHLN